MYFPLMFFFLYEYINAMMCTPSEILFTFPECMAEGIYVSKPKMRPHMSCSYIESNFLCKSRISNNEIQWTL